ncbi:DUF6609 family protein [Alicyclobacillus sp. ALC3]|uniref:DUF6609 family protein n=1 Tax=Alicyclobacillus sp. ALC3 TaxID=2796143 RepID=UPI002378F9EE|nr:DUF6609 family protein [Alicyclobacillus sp. ALC3]WDL96444.1 hypothetical protein JC200_19295 [Alicyclobacillus sp. ALC3]
MNVMLRKLGLKQGERLVFLNKRIAGLWLMWIGMIIFFGTIFGGHYMINPVVFVIGYGVGFGFILRSKIIRDWLSFGASSSFQRNIASLSIIFMFVLMSVFSGRYFATMNFRMIWLGALLATPIHFIPFSCVHGRSFLFLAIPLAALSIAGIADNSIPFWAIGTLDGSIKLGFGIGLYLSRKPTVAVDG